MFVERKAWIQKAIGGGRRGGGLAGVTMPKGAPVGWVLSPDLPLGGRGYRVLTKP